MKHRVGPTPTLWRGLEGCRRWRRRGRWSRNGRWRRGREGWSNFFIQSLQRPVDLAIERFNDRPSYWIRKTGDVTLHVIEQSLLLFAVCLQCRSQVPERCAPQRRPLGQHTDGQSQMFYGFFDLVLVEEAPSRDVFNAAAEQAGKRRARSVGNRRRTPAAIALARISSRSSA